MKDTTRSILRKMAGITVPPEEKDKPKAYSSKANRKGSSDSFPNMGRNIADLNRNWNIFSQEGVAYAAVVAIASNTACDWKVRCEDEDAKREIEEFCYKNDLDSILWDVTRDCLVLRDSFVHRIYTKKGDLSRIKIIDPRTIEIFTDKYGDLEYFVQTIENGNQKEEIKLDPKDVIHYQLMSVPNSPYGQGIIDPVKDTIIRKIKADEGISAAIDRHGFPKYHIILKNPPGFENEVPQQTDINAIASDFRNISVKNEIVTTEYVAIKPLDVKGVENVDEYFNYFQSSLTCGLLVPQEVLGLGSGSTEATARVRQIMFERQCKMFQHKLARTTEREIFKVLFPEISVRLVFADVVPEDDKIVADMLSKIMPKGDPYAILDRNEIRERLGYPPSKEEHISPTETPKSNKVEEKATGDITDLDGLLDEYSDKVKAEVAGRFQE